jgi:hypothetical protein
MLDILIVTILILAAIPTYECSASLPDNQIRSQLDYIYGNNKKWTTDISNKYYDNSVITTGEVRCPKSGSISCVIPEKGTLSFSWMMRSIDDYSNFKFSKNDDKNIEDCASYSSWSDLLTYDVEKDDDLKWVFNLESPPCRSGQGWLYINYTKSINGTPDNDSSNNNVDYDHSEEGFTALNNSYDKSSCKCSIDLTPINPKPGNKNRKINLCISSNKTRFIKAKIQLNLTHDYKIDSSETSGFLRGSIIERNEVNKYIAITLDRVNNPVNNGSTLLKLNLLNPENNSIVKVCIENITLIDINGNNVEIEMPSRCVDSTYVKKG